MKLMIVLFCCIHYKMTDTLLASDKSVVTGEVKFVCAMLREKNYMFDDLLMPEILTFCSCAVIHTNWVITAQRCFVHEDWFVAVVLTPFKNSLPKKLHKIEKIVTKNELVLVKVYPNLNTHPLKIAKHHIQQTTKCLLFGLSTPKDKPVKGTAKHLLYKVWHSTGDVLQTKVEVLYFRECKELFNNSLSAFKRKVTISTSCINPLHNQYIEPCSFDRGAPIVCQNKLQAILIYERPLPKGIPLHLPSGCYGNIDESFSIYAESITSKYADWINKTISSS